MIRSIHLSGLSILALLFLSACANGSANGGLTVSVGNQWPPIRVVIPARRAEQSKPEIAPIARTISVPQPRPVIRPRPVGVKPTPVKTVYRKPAASIPKRNIKRVVLKKRTPATKCRHIVRDLSMPGSRIIYCMPSKAYQ